MFSYPPFLAPPLNVPYRQAVCNVFVAVQITRVITRAQSKVLHYKYRVYLVQDIERTVFFHFILLLVLTSTFHRKGGYEQIKYSRTRTEYIWPAPQRLPVAIAIKTK